MLAYSRVPPFAFILRKIMAVKEWSVRRSGRYFRE